MGDQGQKSLSYLLPFLRERDTFSSECTGNANKVHRRKKFKYSSVLLTGVLQSLDRSLGRIAAISWQECCNLLTGVLTGLQIIKWGFWDNHLLYSHIAN